MKWLEIEKSKNLYSFNQFIKIVISYNYSKKGELLRQDPKAKKYDISFYFNEKEFISIPEEFVTKEETLKLLEEIEEFLKSDEQIYVVKK